MAIWSTRAEPTTTPSARRAMLAACSAVRMPKPMATGSWVWRRRRVTASCTCSRVAEPAPVTPATET
ncbi:hypothetical protein FQZ97_1110130 [compost metagenome]